MGDNQGPPRPEVPDCIMNLECFMVVVMPLQLHRPELSRIEKFDNEDSAILGEKSRCKFDAVIYTVYSAVPLQHPPSSPILLFRQYQKSKLQKPQHPRSRHPESST